MFLGLSKENSQTQKSEISSEKLRAKRTAAVFAAVVFVVLTAGLTWLCIDFFGKFSDPAEFKNYINSFGAWGKLVFLGLQIIQIVIAFIPGEAVQIGAGYAYGAVTGTLLCLLGAAAASAIVFALTRLVGGRLVELFAGKDKIDGLKFINNEQKLERLIFILFLIPGAPKDVLTYLAGLTRIKFRDFLVISTVARTPALLLSVAGGSAVADKSYAKAAVIFVCGAAVSVAGLKIYSSLTKRLSRHTEEKGGDGLSESEQKTSETRKNT